ncbi:MAG: dTMP kinase [Gammaproteobacteria bacterium RIFCSPHIGHO2_12_FULL_42_13]|nr:MAG: dTMP kinase [Gammaproteobacteria bacterium RIFCSPHIGHO2_12_FULL_42_13]
MFITLEGCEGVGKSTALRYLEAYLTQRKKKYVVTREPGGTALGESIRCLLLNRDDEVVLPETELLLLFAARAQHIAHVIKPALAKGKIVISDRFTDSSYAYQGGGRKISAKYIDFLTQWIQDDVVPDLTFLLDAPVRIGLARMKNRQHKDRIEKEKSAFFERVRAAYLARAKKFSKRFVVIYADQPMEIVEQNMINALSKVIS